MASNLEKSGLPIVAIGLGAQADNYDHDIQLSEGTRRWVEVIAKSTKTCNIYTRGPYTSDQIEKLGINGSVVTGGCPSYFINPEPKLGQRVAERWSQIEVPRSISVAAGHQAWLHTREIEHQLIALMMDPACPGQYVVQSMEEMVKISRGVFEGISDHNIKALRNHTVPHYSFDEFKSWCNNYARSFYDVPAWMDSLRRYDLTIGTRYHGIALALQAERMGLTITIDSRTRELCENTGVPHIAAGDIKGAITRSNLKRMIKFDSAKYDLHRSSAAARYRQFLMANGLQPAGYLSRMATIDMPS
ncbi:polysaccharide pyruvyl transferase family protein [Verticiella sediminum]